MLRALYYLLILVLTPSLEALSCRQDLSQRLKLEYQRQVQSYKKMDSDFRGIDPINQPGWISGPKAEVIFLVHGFMGSPAEMKTVGDALAAKGFNVLFGLLPGFGATAKIANQVTFEDYQKWYESQVRALEKCFKKVHLVGFSTGAMLALDYANAHPRDGRIASVSLISPFFSSHSLWGLLVQKLAAQILDSISVRDMYLLTHFPDIQVMLKEPRQYLSEVPLRGAGEVIRGGELNLSRRIIQKTKAPALLFLSDKDQVVNQRESEMLVRKSFSFVDFVHFNSSEAVPHHMMAPSVSAKANGVARKITDFVDSH
jgi:alpha-beta hydrolase superfamily lysophospholipase